METKPQKVLAVSLLTAQLAFILRNLVPLELPLYQAIVHSSLTRQKYARKGQETQQCESITLMGTSRESTTKQKNRTQYKA